MIRRPPRSTLDRSSAESDVYKRQLYVYYKENPLFGQNQSEQNSFTTAVRESAIIPVFDIMGNFAGTKSQGLGNSQNPYAQIARSQNNHARNWDITGSCLLYT